MPRLSEKEQHAHQYRHVHAGQRQRVVDPGVLEGGFVGDGKAGAVACGKRNGVAPHVLREALGGAFLQPVGEQAGQIAKGHGGAGRNLCIGAGKGREIDALRIGVIIAVPGAVLELCLNGNAVAGLHRCVGIPEKQVNGERAEADFGAGCDPLPTGSKAPVVRSFCFQKLMTSTPI